jgi:hypothetical protein
MPTLNSRSGRVPDLSVTQREAFHEPCQTGDRAISGDPPVRSRQLDVCLVLLSLSTDVQHEYFLAHRINEPLQRDAREDVEVYVYVVRGLARQSARVLDRLLHARCWRSIVLPLQRGLHACS